MFVLFCELLLLSPLHPWRANPLVQHRVELVLRCFVVSADRSREAEVYVHFCLSLFLVGLLLFDLFGINCWGNLQALRLRG